MREQLCNPNDIAIIDLEKNTQLVGSHELAKEMLQLLAEKLPRDIAVVSQAYDEQNYANLELAAHKLVGGCAYCGAPALRMAARALEYAANDKNPILIQSNYTTLQQQVARFKQAMNAILITDN